MDMSHYPKIAYICLEFGINDDIKTYAGGLGILAGDTIKTAADLNLPFVGISLLYKNGYFKQIVDEEGNQTTLDDTWDWRSILLPVIDEMEVTVGDITLKISVLKAIIEGQNGSVPLYYINLDHPENPPEYRAISDRLYPQDQEVKRLQQIVIGYSSLQVYRRVVGEDPEIIHINESHAAYSILHLLQSMSKKEVRERFVFTTHTPVTAGHEKHLIEDVRHILGDDLDLLDSDLTSDGVLNLSEISIFYSKYTNAVSKKHKEVTEEMFPGAPVASITNGVHPQSWISHNFQELFDKHLPDWRSDPAHLRKALVIPDNEISGAHGKSKDELHYYIDKRCGIKLDNTKLTIGFARRSAYYKRNDLIFTDYERLNAIGEKFGMIQLVFAGKAHPNDKVGQSYIKKIIEYSKMECDFLNVVYIPDYGMEVSKLLVAGVDVWLNTPIVPMEASGTSGMKAAMNGVPSFSTIDGWWKEGSFEHLTGWNIGNGCEGSDCSEHDIEDLYSKLENVLLPTFHDNPSQWLNIQKHAIALNGSYFNTKRMMEEYLNTAYLRGGKFDAAE